MQGTEKPDQRLGAVPTTVYRFLAEHGLFGDGLFDLFGPRGRPSVPGSVIAVVMVLQRLLGLMPSHRGGSGHRDEGILTEPGADLRRGARGGR